MHAGTSHYGGKKNALRECFRTFKKDEEPDIEVVEYFISQGDATVDIGANFGLYTYALSTLVGPSGKVFSIEPVLSTYQILCSIVKKLKLLNVSPLNYAISESISEVTMHIPRGELGFHNYYRSQIVSNEDKKNRDVKKVTVQSTTIDSLFRGKRISFIKCDVEGHEFACMRGAKEILEKQKPVWLIEINSCMDDPTTEAFRLLELLGFYGYSPWMYADKKLFPYKKKCNNINYFFLTETHVNSLKRRAPHFFLNIYY